MSKSVGQNNREDSSLNMDPLGYISLPSQRANKIDPQVRLLDFKEIYLRADDNHTKKQASRCLDCGNPYCEWKCPLHNMIPNWLELTKNGLFDRAAELMHETNPLPEICGRVCPQDRLCEQACTLQTGFGEVTIGEIEKTIADKALANKWRPDLSNVVMLDKSVAVVGAGPAGLGCAELLVRNGIKVTVYDRYPEIGGLLTFGIPGFKLEKNVIKERRRFLEDMGIRFELNTNVGVDIDIKELEQDHDAIFLGLGCYTSLHGNLEGRENNGVVSALEYLIGNVNHQEQFGMPDSVYQNMKDKDVIVLGGGDTAMDCVRSAVRQNAKKVTCVYRKDKEKMPGSLREVQNAIEEGVEFKFNLQPIKVQSSNKQVIGVEFEQTKIDELIPNDEQRQKILIGTDVVIIAFGFSASPCSWFDKVNLKTDGKGLVQIQKGKQTSAKNIFAGGDMVTGADLVVTAIAQGRDAAKDIMRGFNVSF